MIKKSPEAYRTIGEASKEVGVPSYVLRFWETKFKQIKLIKRPGGRRFYRPEDIDLLVKIKYFLKKDGLTIKQVNDKLDLATNINQNEIDNNTVKTFSEKSLNNREDILKKLNKILEILSK